MDNIIYYVCSECKKKHTINKTISPNILPPPPPLNILLPPPPPPLNIPPPPLFIKIKSVKKLKVNKKKKKIIKKINNSLDVNMITILAKKRMERMKNKTFTIKKDIIEDKPTIILKKRRKIRIVKKERKLSELELLFKNKFKL